MPGYDSWWDVAVAEVSEMESVREARARYEEARKRERCIHFVNGGVAISSAGEDAYTTAGGDAGATFRPPRRKRDGTVYRISI